MEARVTAQMYSTKELPRTTSIFQHNRCTVVVIKFFLTNLFPICVYDTKKISEDAESIIYADDTNLIITGNTVEEVTSKANLVLNTYIN